MDKRLILVNIIQKREMLIGLRCMKNICIFKQKMAYEMRISDWSSDVCSSDLERADLPGRYAQRQPGCDGRRPGDARTDPGAGLPCRHRTLHQRAVRRPRSRRGRSRRRADHAARRRHVRAVRSDEHTSELQSPMRRSYAVFCLKKKNKTNK